MDVHVFHLLVSAVDYVAVNTYFFLLGKLKKMATSVFNFDLNMFVNLVRFMTPRLYRQQVRKFVVHKLLLLQCYNNNRQLLVNLIKQRIQRRVHEICTIIVIHCTPVDDEIVEQQERCSKYSQQAIGFAISTFSGFVLYCESCSTVDTAVKVATSAVFFVAILADLLSWRMKPKWGKALVYISSFHLQIMTFLVFISFDRYNAYAVLFVPLTIAAATLLQRNIWPAGVCQQNTVDTVVGQDLDFMFDLSALILNWDCIITMIITISGHFPSSGLKKYEAAAKTVGFLFFSTIVLSLYLMMVATVRTVALTVRAKYLDVLLMLLLVSALIATSMSFFFFDQASVDEEVPT